MRDSKVQYSNITGVVLSFFFICAFNTESDMIIGEVVVWISQENDSTNIRCFWQ